MRRILVIATCAVVLAGCGGGKAKTSSTTTAPPTIPPATTTTVPQAAVEVRPPTGPIGTSFQLVATRFQPAETLVFEITFPSGKVFKGQAHKAAADGTVTATYLVTSGNPVGAYQVKATGDKGTTASGQFDVTGTGTTSATTATGRTSTTVRRTTTTVHSTTPTTH